MRREKISDAITDIDTKYIEEAANYSYKKRNPIQKIVSLVACICFIVGIGFLWNLTMKGRDSSTVEYGKFAKSSEEGSEFPESEFTFEMSENKSESVADMMAFQYGSELFEDRLHLKENYASVGYLTRKEWNLGETEPLPLDKIHYDLIDRFLNELNEAEFMLLSDIPLDDDSENVYDSKEMCHLYFNMKNGMVVHLRLFEGGYVSFNGFDQICVQIDERVFNELIQILEY